jgi:hypothetical protein
MASDRNRNTQGNYTLEQYSLKKGREFLVNPEASIASQTLFPGNGLLTGRYANTLLAENATDIETFLHGTGANNLAEPPRPQFIAKIKKLDQLSLFETRPIVLPPTWEPEPNQRLRYL